MTKRQNTDTSIKLYVFNALVVLIITIILCEIGLRASDKWITYGELNYNEYQSPYHKKIHSRLKPNISYQVNQKEFSYKNETNSLGFRDIEHMADKGNNIVRILTLGDSFTEGVGAKYQDSWPKRLEQILNSNTNSKVEVLIGGLGGADPIFSYKILKDKFLSYSPDIVILSINNTDIEDIMSLGGYDRYNKNYQKFNKDTLEFFFQYSYIVRAITIDLLDYSYTLLSPKEYKQRRVYALQELSNVVKKFYQLSLEADFHFECIYHPMPLSLKKIIKNKNVLKRHNVRCKDLTSFFKKSIDNVDDYSHKNDGHFNAKGYHLFAKIVEESVPIFKNLIINKAQN